MKRIVTLALVAILGLVAPAHADKALRDGINKGEETQVVSELCERLRSWNARTPWAVDSTSVDDSGQKLISDLVVLLEDRGDSRLEVCVNGSTTIPFSSTRAVVDRIVRILEAGKKGVEDIVGAPDLDSFRQVILADLRVRYAAARISPVKGEKAAVVAEARTFNFVEADLQ